MIPDNTKARWNRHFGTHETMTENMALYARIGYVGYDRRQHGDACLVYLRKKIA
jgi:hypothetical protein